MSEPMNESRPKVSVSLITYNHADFIAQAIESVLMQETDFEYELVIGEDDSSDGTREIVKAYKEKYPDRVRLLLNDRENVIYIDGRPTGRWNFINNLQHCTGQYIALLDGDDYWISPHKLQKQANYLDSHTECAICFHDVRRVFEDSSRVSCSPGIRHKYSLRDLLVRNFVPTCSTMFRNDLFVDFPDWYFAVPIADWPLHILNAQYGDIGYIHEVMSVKREYTGGVGSSRSQLRRAQDDVEILSAVNAHLKFRYDNLIQTGILLRRYRIAVLKKDRYNAVVNLSRFLVSLFLSPYVGCRLLLLRLLRK